MKAVRIHQHGGSDVLSIDDIPKPIPKASEVLVQVKASCLNHMDIWVRKGMPGVGKLPLILGCDASGIVEECGSDVTDFKRGDPVFVYPMTSCGTCEQCQEGHSNLCFHFQILGEHINGTHCEYLCLDQDQFIKFDPSRLTFEEAAAFPLAYFTAWHMLVEKAKVKKGQKVLVIGASSGVGGAAVQIAKLHGAFVITTAGSKEKMKQALHLGADRVIHHYEDSISKSVKEMTSKRGVDIIIEHVGEKVWQECLKSLAWGGKLITCGATTGPIVSLDLRHIFIKQLEIIGSTMGTKKDLIEVYKHMARGGLKTIIGKIFSFQEVRAAHDYLETSQSFGKIVLKWE